MKLELSKKEIFLVVAAWVLLTMIYVFFVGNNFRGWKILFGE